MFDNGNLVHIYDQERDMAVLNDDLMGMLSNSYDAVCIADGESRMLLLNQAFQKVMGIPIREVIGRRIATMVAQGVTDTAATLRVLETRGPATVTINTRAGRQVLSTGVPVFDSEGKIRRVFCNLRDVTDLLQLRESYSASRRLASRYLMELQELRSDRETSERLVTRNPAMQDLIGLAYRLSQVDSNVLINGESGVGKDLVARIIHEASPRRESGSLVKVNCAAIPEHLLESELFGYEGGAFTGARAGGKVGYFEIADKGTLFLDEIGELPLALQVKLLAVLQDRTVTRVGGRKPLSVDIRVLAATNRDLERMVADGLFREDLYYRLSVVPISLPPLRDRVDDIPFLLAHFLSQYNQKYGLSIRLDEEAIETLCAYDWPGNVRELKNLVERLVVTARSESIGKGHLPAKYLSARQAGLVDREESSSLRQAVRRLERDMVQRAMSRCRTREEAATRLGISISSLARRLREGTEG